MTRTLPPLHEGHAPIHLQQAFSDAVDAYEDWGLHMEEPKVRFEDKDVPISSIFGRMRTCDDILPERLLAAVTAIAGDRALQLGASGRVTYAEAALLLRAGCVERLRDEAA